jgi:SAM-dependent methyltransferase
MQVRAKRIVAAVVLLLVAAAATLPVWKPYAKRLKWFVVATNVGQDVARRTGLRTDQISQPDYAAIPDSELPAYVDRINSTFETYLRYGRLDAERLRGAHVLEVGPGETIGVALRFLGAGAERVMAVDKFVPLETSAFHQRLYKTLVRDLPDDEHARIESAVALDNTVRPDPRRLEYVYGEGIEDTAERVQPASFDVIVSNAVMEEIYDSDRIFASLDRLLKPGGRQVHVIDLGDYGMFSKYGFHPLEFLTIPDGVYRYMVEASGQPNRRPLDYYRRTMDLFGYRTEIYRTWVLGAPRRLPEYVTDLQPGRDYTEQQVALVRSIRPRLLPRYRDLPDSDLLTRSILLVADKPLAPPPTARAESRVAP